MKRVDTPDLVRVVGVVLITQSFMVVVWERHWITGMIFALLGVALIGYGRRRGGSRPER